MIVSRSWGVGPARWQERAYLNRQVVVLIAASILTFRPSVRSLRCAVKAWVGLVHASRQQRPTAAAAWRRKRWPKAQPRGASPHSLPTGRQNLLAPMRLLSPRPPSPCPLSPHPPSSPRRIDEQCRRAHDPFIAHRLLYEAPVRVDDARKEAANALAARNLIEDKSAARANVVLSSSPKSLAVRFWWPNRLEQYVPAFRDGRGARIVEHMETEFPKLHRGNHATLLAAGSQHD